MEQKNKSINFWRENVYFLLLCIVAGVFPFSEALVSISIGLMLLQALILRSWLHPTVNSRSWEIVIFPFSIFAIYLIGTLFTKDFSFALYELKKVVFWVIVPLSVFLSPKLSDKKIYLVFLVFISAVFISSFIFAGKLILHDYFQLIGFRNISFISHIRFSFQVILAIIIVTWFLIKNIYKVFHLKPFLPVVLLLWFIYFLILLKSLLGIISFFATLGISLIFYAGQLKNRKWRYLMISAFFIVTFVPAFFVVNVINDFYDYKPINPKTVANNTISGNWYSHDFEDKLRENGYLVNVYICEDELRKEWNKRSNIKYDDILNGYPLSSTLIRYMTSLGYRKDSAGVSNLTYSDIQLIENGVTNYKFKNRFISIYPRIYETIWELDSYFRSGDPNNKSLAQRIEYVKASLLLIKEKPFFGIGTGNWVIEYDEVYEKMDSKLVKEKRGPSHNQYLNYMVKFGLVGFVLIFCAILIPFFKVEHKSNFIFVLFLMVYAFANFGDSNLETHMGLSFFTFFYFLLLWNSTTAMKTSINKD